ncbi:MAG: CPBP family intramembrane metalloprotease [Clostridia bacterium]|nr:CPBP family intramembrane metalloprotease [Clostridia bacterium]
METLPEEIILPDRNGARRTASRCAFAAVVTMAIGYALVILYQYLTRDLVLPEQLGADLWLIVNTVVMDLIAMPIAWLLLLRRIPKDPALQSDGAERTPLRVPMLLFFFPCVYALAVAGSIPGRIFGLLGGDLTDPAADMILAMDPWAVILSTVILAPVAEELFFRKALIDRLSAYHPMDAILYSALLFGLIHGNLTQFLYAFPIGVLLGIIYRRTRNIRYTILLHMGMNTLGGLLPLLVQRLQTAGEGSEGMAMLGTLATMLVGSLTIGLVVVGVIFLVRGRRRFLPIESDLPRFRRPFYINAGFIVACVVFTGLFIMTEWVS